MVTLDIFTLSAVVIAVTEAAKMAFKIPISLIPITSIAIAISFGGTAAFWGLTDLTLWEGLLAGLAAGGLWDLGKKPVVTISKTILKK